MTDLGADERRYRTDRQLMRQYTGRAHFPVAAVALCSEVQIVERRQLLH